MLKKCLVKTLQTFCLASFTLSVFAYLWLLVENFTSQESACEKINRNEFYTKEIKLQLCWLLLSRMTNFKAC